ncbi:MAG: NHL repeat-containing protein [bacterium]
MKSKYLRVMRAAGWLAVIALLWMPPPVYAFKTHLIKYLFEFTGSPEKRFEQPTDLAVNGKKQIYVLDGVNSRVVAFDYQGKYLFEFGSAGKEDGQLNMPLGLDLDKKGNVYIADTRNHRLQIFGSQGKFIEKYDLPKFKTSLKEPDPTDVLVVTPRDGDETLYIADNDNHRVLVLERENLKLVRTIGKHGFEEQGSFRYPFKLASDSDYSLYVVDVLNTRVQKFSSTGKYLRKIGRWGIKEGTFYRPKGVAVDNEDNVYVSDSYMGVIQAFKPTGEYDGVLAEREDLEKKFKTPVHIYLDQQKRLYVIEELDDRVSVYNILN